MVNLLSELKRRHIFRVAGAYAVVGRPAFCRPVGADDFVCD